MLNSPAIQRAESHELEVSFRSVDVSSLALTKKKES